VRDGVSVAGEPTDDAEAAAEAAPRAREAVAPDNEKLLMQQSDALWAEYVGDDRDSSTADGGAWAHAAPQPEVGGLLLRMPLPYQLRSEMRAGSSVWGDRLAARLRELKPEPEAEEKEAADGSGTKAATGDPAMEEATGERARRLERAWSTDPLRRAYMHKQAEGLINECLAGIARKADGGKIRFDQLNDEEKVSSQGHTAAAPSRTLPTPSAEGKPASLCARGAGHGQGIFCRGGRVARGCAGAAGRQGRLGGCGRRARSGPQPASRQEVRRANGASDPQRRRGGQVHRPQQRHSSAIPAP
jgi:hypothetical protein